MQYLYVFSKVHTFLIWVLVLCFVLVWALTGSDAHTQSHKEKVWSTFKELNFKLF